MTEKFTNVSFDFDEECIILQENNSENYYDEKGLEDLLNEQEERIKELENKLNQTALEFLNHAIISMGKAVEISEMSYHDFIKYRAEQGNPMELQL